MNLEKIFKGAEDHDKPLQERVFAVLPLIGLLALFLLIFIGIMVQDDIINTILITICFILFWIIVKVSRKKRKIKEGATLIAAILVLVLLPVTFVFGGSIYGGAPEWFILGFAYIGMTMEGKRKYILLGIGAITSGIAYYVAYKFPNLIPVHTKTAEYADSLISVLLVSAIITAMIMLQNRIFAAENQLIEKQKKEIEALSSTKNEFFSNVSHEIRTPIDSIMGFNELILRSAQDRETLDNAQNIKSASRMLITLINDLLDLSKIESARMEIQPVEYNTVSMISEALNIVWEFAKEKGLEFKVQIEPDVPQRLWGDDIRIEQILLNIIGNAIKYTEKGSVTFKVQCRRHDDRSCDMIFSVTDTGIGIKRERLNQIFDEFVRVGGSETKNEIGTGLGLSIAKQLTEQMNGEIKVNSIYTKGSTFVITIPQGIRKEDSVGIVDIQTLRSHEEAAVYRQSFEAPGARILIVDDNSLNRKATVKLLRDTKIIIDQEKSGQGCLERCANTHYDCIFLDQEMPEMDGIECIRQIRSQVGGLSRETPIVVITAFSSPDDRNRFRMAGFDGYLPKPVSGEMLENTLLRLLPAERVHRTSEEDQGLEVIKKEKEKIPILITTESACDLPKELLDKMGIPIVHFYIKNKNGSFIDDVEVDTEGILKYMAKDGGYDMSPDTPTVDDFEKFFAEHLVEAENIIHISMSSKASGAFWCSSEAAKAFDNVTIIDSESLSCGMGQLVLEAHRLVEAGASVLECVEKLNIAKKHVHLSYFVNDMEYLIRLGRAKRRVKGIGRIFMLRPSITFKDGRGTLMRMLVGSIEFAKKKYVNAALSNSKEIDKSRVFIIHTGLQVSELEDISRWVQDLVPFEEVIIQKESAAMAAIHGPGAFGISFMYNEE